MVHLTKKRSRLDSIEAYACSCPTGICSCSGQCSCFCDCSIAGYAYADGLDLGASPTFDEMFDGNALTESSYVQG